MSAAGGKRGQLMLRQSLLSLQQNIHAVQFPVFHHAADFAGILNVGQRISVDEHEVGKFAGFDAAKIAGSAESVGSGRGRGL